jgi:hypothetical protein
VPALGHAARGEAIEADGREHERGTVAIYTLDRQGGSATHFIVRTSGDAAALLPSVPRLTLEG